MRQLFNVGREKDKGKEVKGFSWILAKAVDRRRDGQRDNMGQTSESRIADDVEGMRDKITRGVRVLDSRDERTF